MSKTKKIKMTDCQAINEHGLDFSDIQTEPKKLTQSEALAAVHNALLAAYKSGRTSAETYQALKKSLDISETVFRKYWRQKVVAKKTAKKRKTAQPKKHEELELLRKAKEYDSIMNIVQERVAVFYPELKNNINWHKTKPKVLLDALGKLTEIRRHNVVTEEDIKNWEELEKKIAQKQQNIF